MSGNFVSGNTRKWLTRSLLAIAAAMPAAGAHAALIGVDSVTTVTGTGTSSTDTAPGADKSHFFNDKTTYNLDWMGEKQSISSITAGGTTYNFITPADNVIIRSNQTNTKSPNNQMIWYQGSVSGTNVNLTGTRYNSLAATLKANDIFSGVDNLFTNRNGGNGDNTRTERLDVIFSQGVTAAPNKLFGVFDRGKSNQHDPFKIAAITSVDANGNPTGYGNVLSVAKGWGQTAALGSVLSSIVMRNSPGNSNLTSPAAVVPQPVGGVLIPLSDLVGKGVTVYGYSLFAYDVTGSGNNLLDWNNYNKKTNHNFGGLDMLSFTGLIQCQPSSIPEPAALSLIGLAGLAMMRRRRRA
jgi:MYXO-CTERM domain-containing protein